MFVLFVDTKIKPGRSKLLRHLHRDLQGCHFAAGGFRGAELLRPNQDHNRDSGEYRLSNAFETRLLRKKWVASHKHQAVWPQVESHCADYAVKDYTAV